MKKVKAKNIEGTLRFYTHGEMMLRLRTKPELAQFFFPAFNEDIQATPIGFIFNSDRDSIRYLEIKTGVFEKVRTKGYSKK